MGLGRQLKYLQLSSAFPTPDQTANRHTALGNRALQDTETILSHFYKTAKLPVLVLKSQIFFCMKSILKLLYVPWRHYSS